MTSLFSKPLAAQVEKRVAAEERTLVEIDEALETGFERGIFDRQFAPDELVGLFEPQRIHRADAEGLDPERRARLHQGVEDIVLHLDRMMQLVAEFADEIDAKREKVRRPHREPPRAQPRESLG